MPEPTDIRYFPSPSAFRTWLRRNHGTKDELWVGFYKKGTGKPSLTWPQSVDQALCFGWIDGVRRTIDEERYTIRFTPRRPTSKWSAKNLARMEELIHEGAVEPAGLEVYQARSKKAAGYSFETTPAAFPKAYLAKLKRNQKAWEWFSSRAPWYRRTATHWVMSAKKDETRLRRLEQLVSDSARGELIRPLAWTQKGQAKKTAGTKAPARNARTSAPKKARGKPRSKPAARKAAGAKPRSKGAARKAAGAKPRSKGAARKKALSTKTAKRPRA